MLVWPESERRKEESEMKHLRPLCCLSKVWQACWGILELKVTFSESSESLPCAVIGWEQPVWQGWGLGANTVMEFRAQQLETLLDDIFCSSRSYSHQSGRVSQTCHYWHFEPNNSMLWDLSCARRMFTSIPCPYPLDISSLLPSSDRQNCLQLLPNVLGERGQNHFQVRNIKPGKFRETWDGFSGKL